ncbi:hypothetical protein DXB61_06475 [Parabacteroides merdae]|uniref:Uncharacterized protein n=2 Tax=Parabacteroides merdae TaxID=46503 RepID=A0AB37LUW6_9BACT|nr:hypothetical protein DXB61_06475 [Parabacteroides merdae]RGT00504.1 hypothetical protein DWX56_10040 [Parabacteroides merdae]
MFLFPQRYDLSAIKKPEKQIINGLMEKSKRLSENRLAHSEKNVGVLQITSYELQVKIRGTLYFFTLSINQNKL